VEAGTVLRVTPHIIKNNDGTSSIKLAVSVQDNQNDSNDSPLKANGISPVKQTKINTQAIVGSNQSLLIGGYYYEEKTENESGVPVLKNIPLLGYLFKNSSKGTRRMERLILITPKIIRLDELPKTPEYIDTKEFSKSPTQSDYERRLQPEQSGSGCVKKSTPVQN
jgi:type III secretion protein C